MKRLGANSADLIAIAQAVPKSEYYVMQPDGNRLISLELVAGHAGAAGIWRQGPGTARQPHRRKGPESGGSGLGSVLRGLDGWAERYEVLARINKQDAAKEAAIAYA